MRQKSKDEIAEMVREIIQEELKDWIESFMKYEITGDFGAQGPGEIPGRVEKQNLFVFDALMIYLPRIAAAMRGSQADSATAKNRAIEARNSVQQLEQKVDALGQTLLSMEGSVNIMAKFAIALKQTGLLEQMEKALTIEYKPDETDTMQEEQ